MRILRIFIRKTNIIRLNFDWSSLMWVCKDEERRWASSGVFSVAARRYVLLDEWMISGHYSLIRSSSSVSWWRLSCRGRERERGREGMMMLCTIRVNVNKKWMKRWMINSKRGRGRSLHETNQWLFCILVWELSQAFPIHGVLECVHLPELALCEDDIA